MTPDEPRPAGDEGAGHGRFRGETRASNLPMQRLFEKMGYRLDRVEENYYHNPEESAYKYLLQF